MKNLFLFFLISSLLLSCGGDFLNSALEETTQMMLKEQKKIEAKIQKEYEKLGEVEGLNEIRSASSSFKKIIANIRADIITESGGYIQNEDGIQSLKEPNNRQAVKNVLEKNNRFEDFVQEVDRYDEKLRFFLENTKDKKLKFLSEVVYGKQTKEQMEGLMMNSDVKTCLILLLSFQYSEMNNHYELLRSLRTE